MFLDWLYRVLYPRDERLRPLVRVVWWLATMGAAALLALTPFLRERVYPPFGQRYPGQPVPQTTEGKLFEGVILLIVVLVFAFVVDPTRRSRRRG